MIRRRLLTGTLSNAAGKLISVGIWFVLTPFVLGQLGTAGYGLWMLVGAVGAYGSLLDLGIGGAVVKYVAQHAARGEWDDAREVLASAQWLYLGLGLIAVTLSAALAPLFPDLVGIAANDRVLATSVVMLTGVDIGFAIALTPARSALQGLQRYDLCNIVSTSGVLIGAAAVVTVLLAGWGVLGMIAASIPITIGMGIASRWWTRRVAPELEFGWRYANRATLRRITSFSASLFAMQCGGRLQTKSDEFVIAVFRPVDAVTPYVLSRKLGEVAQLAAVQFLNVLMPLASELDARGDRHRLRTLYIAASRVTLGITAPVAVVLVLLGGQLLTWWVGAAYARHADLVAVLAVSSLIGVSQWPAAAILQGMSRHRILAVTSLGAGVANITLSVLLLPVLGLIGVGLGTLIPTTIGSLCVILPVTARIVDVPMHVVLRDVWIPGLLPGVAAAGVLWVPWHAAGTTPLASLVGWILLSGIVYAAAYLSMPAASVERQFLSEIVRGGSRRLRPRASSLRIDQQQP